MTKKTKYLWYVEETKKHHSTITRTVKKSVRDALIKAKKNKITVTYLNGTDIVVERPNGGKRTMKVLEIRPRTVEVGEKTRI